MPFLTRIFLAAIACMTLIPFESLQAQLRGGASDRDRPGMGGRVSARREDRANRILGPASGNSPAAAAAGAPGAGAAGRNPLVRPPAGPGAPNLAANARTANPNAQLNNGPGTNTLPRASSTAAAGAINRNAPGSYNASDVRSAYYGGTAGSALAGEASAAIGRTPNSAVAAASGSGSRTLPPNRLPYKGPGVLIRLPTELRGEVNYLVDDTEHLVVHPGEEQLLRLKGSYDIRFSRGVTNDGRSYGEGHYSVTEGIYRFDITDKGWELYREADGAALAARVDELNRRELDRLSAGTDANSSAPTPFSDSPRDALEIDAPLPPASAMRRESAADTKAERRDVPPLPSPAASSEPASPSTNASEETLPAPRSILEPS